ncbi:hypothetical protein ACTVJH_12385 [Desulfoplanes sp. PS50]
MMSFCPDDNRTTPSPEINLFFVKNAMGWPRQLSPCLPDRFFSLSFFIQDAHQFFHNLVIVKEVVAFFDVYTTFCSDVSL